MAFKMGKPSLLKMVSALKNKEKLHFLERNKVGPIADPHGVYDDSEHNVHARKTEGTIKEQDLYRKQRKDDPGNKYDPSKDKE